MHEITIVKRAIFGNISSRKNKKKINSVLRFKKTLKVIMKHKRSALLRLRMTAMDCERRRGRLCKMHSRDLALTRFTPSLEMTPKWNFLEFLCVALKSL